MSSCNKSTTKSNMKNKVTNVKTDHLMKFSDPLKSEKLQQKTDHIKYTHIIDHRVNNKDDIVRQEHIKQIMELTRKSEDEVIMALHDRDGDLNLAVNDLLEGISPEWEVKKKKARQSTGSKQNLEQSNIQDSSIDWDDKEFSHNDGSSRIRSRAGHNNRGWRRRENKENEKNTDDFKYGISHNSKRGRAISSKSGRGGRSGGRSLGPRTYANRGESSGTSFTRPIDTWTGNEEQLKNSKESKLDSWNVADASEDWYNEEYTGSLADTKVFTPSTIINELVTTSDESKNNDQLSNKNLQSTSTSLTNNDLPKVSDMSANQESIVQEHSCQQLIKMSSLQLKHSDNDANKDNLSTVQSEYCTQLSQQSNDIHSSGQTTYLSVISSQPQRPTKPRPRVPPPSKIPSTAVEMPGDALNNSISFLDVQFGALEFGSDTNISDASNQDKYNSSGTSIEPSSLSSKTIANSIGTLTVEVTQATTQKFNTATKILRSDNQCISSSEQPITSQSTFANRTIVTQPSDTQKQDISLESSLDSTSTYSVTVTYPSSKTSYSTPVTASNYNSYSSQQNQTSFVCSTTTCSTKSFSTIVPVTQTGYNSSYTQSNITTFSQTSPSSSGTTGIYNQTSTTSQGYQSGFTTTSATQYQSQPVSTTAASNSSYISTGFQNSSTFQPTTPTYQTPNTTYSSSITQGSSVYSNAVQSVYSNSYSTYGCQSQSGSQEHKINTNKDLQYDNAVTTSTPLVTTTSCTLGLSSSVSASQTKTTISSSVPKSTVSGLAPNSSSSSSSSNTSSSGTTGNIAPILGHQYIMGQSVPYATFQQPHMYSYEDLQLMQQRIPHMPTSGYYDATLGYQTTGPVTSLGNSRSDPLSGVQSVQGVQAVQGQYTGISDARFTRTDNNASPVSSTISQQTATQHQQPLMNPIPPGYAYFYGGGIMPASGFQYGTPAIYPQIATAGSAGTTSAAYSTKPGSYGTTYGSGTNYDNLTNTGPSGEYKSSGSGFNSNQTAKNGSANGNVNTAGTSTDINSTMYAKGHVALNKVTSYEKQTFHSATPPPFGLTNNQNANVISGYGATHLFIPTVPHQLHQQLHQESGSSSGPRTNTNTQNKAQVKPGYSTSYWAGGN